MISIKSIAVGILCLIATMLTAGCGGGGNAQIRVMNASPDISTVDAGINNKNVASAVAYGTASTYVSVNSGSVTLQMGPTGATTPLINQSISLGSGSTSTLVAANFSASIALDILTDDNTPPTSGNVKIRLVNESPGLGLADVYLVTPGTSLTTVNPTASLGFQAASTYQQVAAGNYEVFFTLPGQKFPSIDSGPLTLAAGQIRTVVALDSQAGGLTAVVLNDLN